MLKDIERGWHRIDWNEAMGNLAGNAVEDLLIGKWNRFFNKLTPSAGPGLATRTQGGYGSHHQSDKGGFQGTGHPASDVADVVGDWVTSAAQSVNFSENIGRPAAERAYYATQGIRRLGRGISAP